MVAKQAKVFMSIKKIAILILVLTTLVSSACRDDDQVDPTRDFFPPVNVYVTVNTLFPQFADLNVPLGFVYLREGYRGIILYRTGEDRYVAFDRTCSFNTKDSCAFVSMDSNRVQMRCGQFNPDFQPCCNSRFDASSGIPISGDARIPLRQYFTAVQGTTIIISSNPL
jgi:nitrite reductase/ring-hydroxylating ferredoxin subunit